MATIQGTDGLFPFRVEAFDGDKLGGNQSDRFVIKIWASGGDPDAPGHGILYQASGDFGRGQVKIHDEDRERPLA